MNIKKDLPFILVAAVLVYIIDFAVLKGMGLIPAMEFLIDVVLFYVFFKTIKSEMPKKRKH